MPQALILDLLQNLFNKLGIIVLIAFLLSRTKFIIDFLAKRNLTLKDKCFFSILFGCIGIIGTYSGVPIQGAIANSRSIGVIVAGIFGGPVVGIMAGLIAGIHRMIIPVGRFTAIACGLSTIVGGIIAGYSKTFILDRKNKWVAGALLTITIEAIQMAMILLISRPFSNALDLVKIIFVPMSFINAFGTGSFILLIEQIHKENESIAAKKASLALKIATKTLPILRNGLSQQSAHETALIIHSISGVNAVSFTNKSTILAHIGVGSDHHKAGAPIYTDMTKNAIKTGHHIVANSKEEIECAKDTCRLQSAIVVPLYMKEQVIGTLKLYKITPNDITASDIELAKGLGHLFSTQLELSQISYLKELRSNAEIKALQAQIQPHFLFNALNTIISFCRTDANKARMLLTKLSQYLRTSFQINEAFIPFAKELQHIKNYLDIEEARFSHRLEVIYDVDEDINCHIPPLLIQPLVENALKHGLRNIQESGRLYILAKKVNGGAFVQIKDNGCGMSNDKIKQLLTESEQNTGVGLKNVNNRLKQIYNTELQIESKLTKGTKISFLIPECKKRTGKDESDESYNC